MKFSQVIILALLTILVEKAAIAAKPLTISASGRIESLTAHGRGGYRVTLKGFAKVLHAGPEESVIACLRKGSEKGESIELRIDLSGNILSCRLAPHNSQLARARGAGR
jgi:hypothetical protein